MFLLYHAYVYLEFLILACTIYILAPGPIESINRKVKDLKRLGRGFRNFEHFRNRFLYATRSAPVLNGVSDYNPVTYFEEDEF